jgi:hypothetical protein
MGYTLGQAAKACGMSKTSIFRSIKAGRISAARDELGQWAIEPCELHRVHPPPHGRQRYGERNGGTSRNRRGHGSRGGKRARFPARTAARRSQAMLDDMRGQRDDMRGERDHWREQAQRLVLADQRGRPGALQAEPERRGWWSRLAG